MVDKSRLRLAGAMREQIPAIRIAMRVDREAIKHGGVVLGIGKNKKKRVNDLFAKTVLNWATRLNADQDTFGFGIAKAARPQAGIQALFNRDQDSFSDFEQQVFAIDPRSVDVYHKANLLGEHMWVVCEPPDHIKGTMQPVPIPGCYVFWRDPPDEAGMPRSTVLSLYPAYQFLHAMEECQLVSARKRASPPLVTERVVSQKDPQLQGILPMCGDGDGDNKTGYEEITLKEQLMDRMVRLENTMGGPEKRLLSSYTSLLGIAAAQVQQEMTLGERFDLPAERKLAKQVQAEGPGMELQKLQIHFEQVVLMTFGIPPGQIQPESTHGKMVSNDNIREVYNTHLSTKKQELVLAMEVMLRKVYQMAISVRYAVKYKASLVETIKDNTLITVELASIPDELSMTTYYEKGWLKWDALRDYLATKHVLPLESFEDTPKLTQMDLLTKGKPPPPPADGKQQKKRKRPAD
jgi:hypothetical protein